jgi:3-deoxy-D-manno-octulosonic-acid transferase
VSVGEVVAAIPLVKVLIERYPHTIIVITVMTPTGADKVQQIFGDKVLQLYVPYDSPGMIKRFLYHMNPKLLVLMETELWPNILCYTHQRKIPIILCNARLSDKSFSGYMKIRTFITSVLNYVTIVMAQSDMDGDRFLTLGLMMQKLSIVGNTKFDLVIPEEVSSQANNLRSIFGLTRPIWVAASTHENEEEKILIAAKKVLEVLPDALLILVPRHPERFNPVFEICRRKEFKVVRYSNMQNYTISTNIILGDVMGQLLLFYAVSDIAFVGGSLIPWGGHNLLEPAALAKPVISGRYLSAFLEISLVLSAVGGLITVTNELELARNLLKLFRNRNLQEQLGLAASSVITKHRGATQKILAVITDILAGRLVKTT